MTGRSILFEEVSIEVEVLAAKKGHTTLRVHLIHHTKQGADQALYKPVEVEVGGRTIINGLFHKVEGEHN